MKIKLPYLTFEVTSVCNLKCRYCYNIWKMPDTTDFKHFNSYKQARKTLKQIFKVADVSHITFTGGEPFMAERFAELVLFVRMNKKSVSIITNGNFATPKTYQIMNNIGVGLFELPIHSNTAKIHDFMTATKGSWQKSVNSIKELIRIKKNVVPVVVKTKANYNIIGETLEFIHSLGLKRIMLNRFNIGGQGISEKENLYITKKELNEALKNASEIGYKLKLSLSSNVCTPLCVVATNDYRNIQFTTCSPDITKRPLTIDVHGDLRFCNHSPTILGNIFKDNIKEMLNSEKAQLWNNIIPDFCKDCDLYSKSMAGCRAAAEQLKMSLNSPDPIVTDIENNLY